MENSNIPEVAPKNNVFTKLRAFYERLHNLDMTRGNISKNLILFALPLLLGNLFQQIYNLVDTWVIGQTNDTAAYAAVGSLMPVLNIMIGFFSGLATGAGVVISQYFGAGEEENVSKTVHTTMIVTIVSSVVISAVGVLTAPLMATWMLGGKDKLNPDVFQACVDYLVIYFAGATGLCFYNMGTGILRAIGDSFRPFLFIIVCALINIGLDLLFVNSYGMGVKGVALATIIAQFISAVLVMIVLLRHKGPVRIRLRLLKCDGKILKHIFKIGLPAGVQMAITAFSNVFVTSYIASANGDQDINLGAWTTYSKVDAFIMLPLQSLSLAINTFVGQNLGMGDIKRARQGTMAGYKMANFITLAAILIIEIFSPWLASLFIKNQDIIDNSVTLLRVFTPFYFFCCINQIFSGSLRGSGDSIPPMAFMLGSFVVIRQIFLFVVSTWISKDLLVMGISYPVGWICCAIATLTYYLKCDYGSKKITGNKK